MSFNYQYDDDYVDAKAQNDAEQEQQYNEEQDKLQKEKEFNEMFVPTEPVDMNVHTCQDGDQECFACGINDCPHKDPLHYDDDGCPSCYSEEQNLIHHHCISKNRVRENIIELALSFERCHPEDIHTIQCIQLYADNLLKELGLD